VSLLEELLELLLLLLELVEELLELLELLEELCVFWYCSCSSLRLVLHSELSDLPLFWNLHTLTSILLPLIPRPTANSGEHPLSFVGAFKT
jgi:hypothetical protein